MRQDTTYMECPECGMGYLKGFAEDEREHKRYHDKIVNGLYAPKIKSDRILWELNDLHIVLVDDLSPTSQKKRAESVGFIAHKDTPFDFTPYDHLNPPDESDTHVFLLYKKNRGVGFLIVDKREHVKKFSWTEYENAGGTRIPIISNPTWSIGLAWILSKHRKLGLASKLVETAALYLEVDLKKIGWYVPFTKNGEKLVMKICPTSFFATR